MAKKKKTSKKRKVKARKRKIIRKSRKRAFVILKRKRVKTGFSYKKSRKSKKIAKTRRISKKKKLKRPQKPKKPVHITDFPAGAFFKTRIKVIGVGGGGGSIVSEIGRSLHRATFVIADTDTRAFKKRRGIKYLFLGRELTHGLGTGLNPNLAKLAAEQEKSKIADIFKGQNIVIFIASLGGGIWVWCHACFCRGRPKFRRRHLWNIHPTV